MSFKVPLILKDQHRGAARSGAGAIARSARRHNLSLGTRSALQDDTPVSQASGTGSSQVPVESVLDDLEYVVEVTVGTPGIKLRLTVDTGVADFWVLGPRASANAEALSKHSIYDPSKSSTSKKVDGPPWHTIFGEDPYISGVVYSDVVQLGSLIVEAQDVQVATRISQSFIDQTGSDGVLGLGWPIGHHALPQQKTVVQRLWEQASIEKGVFSVYLKKNASGPDGFVSFGSIPINDVGLSADDIFYCPADNSTGYWSVKSCVTTVDGRPVGDPQPDNTAILDSGTTLVLLSDDVVKAVYAAIPGAKLDHHFGGWVYPENAKIPDIKIAVEERMVTLLPEVFGYGEVMDGFRFGGVQSRGSNWFDILGDLFFKSVFAVFDLENTRVGLAQRQSDLAGSRALVPGKV